MTEREYKICERFKEIRITLKKKQGDFAKEIKTTQGHVSDIENKRKNVSDRVIEIIRLKYNVNENWLRTGVGDMFIQESKDDQVIQMLVEIQKSGEDSFKRRFLCALTSFSEKDWENLENMFHFMNKINKKTGS